MSSSAPSFGDRLRRAFDAYGRLCVGVDPHEHLLDSWGLADSAAGAREFGLRVVEAAQGSVGVVKPQVAFFERFGSAGIRSLEDVIAAARAARLLVIADAKRGDIGSSVEAYGRAWLDPASPLESDALTVSAFQGVGSLATTMERAEREGKGVFVLAATSNPEARAIQTARIPGRVDDRTVARAIIEDVTSFNDQQSEHAFGSVGVVIGATVVPQEFGIETRRAPGRDALAILAPGFGYQGGAISEAAERFGSLISGVIVSESRSLLSAGPSGIAEAIRIRAAEVRAAFA